MTYEKVKSIVMANLAHPVLDVGGDTKKLPFHITIIPPFRHDRIATAPISRLIAEELERIEPFTVIAGEEAMLEVNRRDGREGMLARKVASQALYTVHNILTPVIQEFPSVEMDTRYAFDKFRPHTTYTETQRLNKNDKRRIDTLYLYQKTKLSHGHPTWYVAAKYPLGKKSEAAS